MKLMRMEMERGRGGARPRRARRRRGEEAHSTPPVPVVCEADSAKHELPVVTGIHLLDLDSALWFAFSTNDSHGLLDGILRKIASGKPLKTCKVSWVSWVGFAGDASTFHGIFCMLAIP